MPPLQIVLPVRLLSTRSVRTANIIYSVIRDLLLIVKPIPGVHNNSICKNINYNYSTGNHLNNCIAYKQSEYLVGCIV